MMKHLFGILLLFFICVGLMTVSHEEQSDLRAYAGSQTGAINAYVNSDCSFSASTEYTSPIPLHSHFNDGKSDSRINNALCPTNSYTHNNVSSKLLKIRLHLPAGQLQHSLADQLSVLFNPTQSFTPNAIRYSYGYYIYALAHILI